MPKPTKKVVQVNLRPVDDLEPQRIYANFMDVNYNPYDFTLRFADAGPIFNLETLTNGAKYEHKIPIVAQIAMPAAVIPAVIQALSTQLKSYEEAYGKVKSAPEEADKTTPQ